CFFFFQAEDGIRDRNVTGVQTCALPIFFLIPIFVIVLIVPVDWGQWEIGYNELPVAHFVGALLFIIASVTDWVDGYYARKYNLVTTLGKFLDPLADKLLVSAGFILLVELGLARSEERRVGKECISVWLSYWLL